ncbi:MAG: CAP domain-containing protein [Chloroflexota bacterium]
MKKITFLCLAFATLLIQITFASAQSANSGSVQGFVHVDINGDGICQDSIPLPGIIIDVDIPSVNSKIRVFSSSDGSYNVGSTNQGTWRLAASSGSNRWVAVPPNPKLIEVTSSEGLTKEGVNFCMQRVAVTTSTTNTEPNDSRTTAEQSSTASSSINENMSLSEQSESLLTNPPEPIQPSTEELAKIENESLEDVAINVDTWLDYANSIREMAGVPLVTQDDSLTAGAQAHARYMVVHDRPIAHAEDPSFALYSEAGHIAASKGLIFSTSQIQADHTWAFNFWTSGTFHLIPLIDPYLKTVGYGNYNQDIGNFKMSAVIDVGSGLDTPDGSYEYPVMFPTDGAETWVVRQSLYEWPDPAASCPGFERPTGAPIVLMLQEDPTISTAPRVSSYKIEKDGVPISNICMFHENSYSSSNSAEQTVGRTILNLRDAIVLIPRDPLTINSTYDVEIVANGETHSWSFNTRKSP